ncbi:DUF4352 domain-containing protein [Facklamia sp. DSM 111018]|uniref:DUF4352 domain-containing protein n=1 Tax=Facklamia lactis TaxID=2749967 RepID=A0ABS0LRZ9_9LACT|nr:DUF4352 domain-containing protein [Facklamia lactis]MBG9981137.1 DUF4352 domain-containing protein [Facklamia lactis]MBG9986938.1 DUF4352 domain-containing protein [Facklamia lactis]
MKNSLVLLASLMTLAATMPVYAQDSTDAESIESEIATKKEELEKLEEKLKELAGEDTSDDAESTDGSEESSDEDGEDDESSEGSDVIGETFEHMGIEVTIEDVYLTEEREKYNDDEYEYVLRIEYTIANNTEESYSAGYDFELYVDGKKADDYYFSDDKSDSISPGRQTDVINSFGFNNEPENMELEFKNYMEYSGEAPVIIPLEDLEVRKAE